MFAFFSQMGYTILKKQGGKFMEEKCSKQCDKCKRQCIVKSAKYIVVGDIKITLAEGDKKP
jgi:hypothetical protein